MDDTEHGSRIRGLLASGDPDAALAEATSWRKARPDSAEAANAMGAALAAKREFRAAADAFRRATELDPTMSKALSNLGSALQSLGDAAGAVASLSRAVQLEPGNARAWMNLGNALRATGRTDDATQAYGRSVAIRPSAGAHYNLGTLHAERGRAGQAASELRRSLRLEPEGPHAWPAREALMTVLIGDGRAEEASAVFEASGGASSAPTRIAMARALLELSGPRPAAELLGDVEVDASARGPHSAVMSRIREGLGDLEGAESAALSAANELATVRAWCEVARLRIRRHDIGGALSALDRAEEVEPTSVAPALFRGEIALLGNDVAAAEASFREAATRAPFAPEPVSNLAQVALRRGDAEEALRLHRAALALRPEHPLAHSNLLVTLLYRDRPADELLRETLAWSTRRPRLAPSTRFRVSTETPRRRRIGYVSANLRKHAVACFLEELVVHHDRTRFELFFYNASESRDAVTERLQIHGDAWRDVHSASDHRLAGMIRDDGIDVLVDLNGHTAGGRLGAFAARPAPVSLSFLGYPATTGVAAIDARITDAHADPIGLADRHATEQLVRLPRCAWAFRPDDDSPDVTPRPPAAPVVFGVFNNVAKITEEARRTFAEILRRVPHSKLLFKGRTLGDPETKARFLAAFAAAGVANRVELRSWVLGHVDHLATYAEVDIQLDSFPYAGTTTTCESMWMGVPVVTLAGDRHAGRVGVSLLHAVGLAELVANDVTDYIEKAVGLATDRGRLHALRTTMRTRMEGSELRDGVGYARAVEAVYERLSDAWRNHAAATGGAPDAWLARSDGAVVNTPDDVSCATRFMLEERGDGFERELSFVRTYLGEDDVAADVGASFDSYALSMAKRVGGAGRVLAFEPAPRTAAHLRYAAARAPALRVLELAVGAERGRTRLETDGSPKPGELALDPQATTETPFVDVEVVPLSDFAEELRGVRFIKVDADGSEELVLAGARGLLASEDPIWMWGLRHGKVVHRRLVEALAKTAPHLVTMRWIAPLEVLVALDLEGPLDDRWLHFFSVSEPRIRELVQRGMALAPAPTPPPTDAVGDPIADALMHRSAAWSCADPAARYGSLTLALDAARRAAREVWTLDGAFLHARIAYEHGRDGEARSVIDGVLARLAQGDELRLSPSMPPPLPAQDDRLSEARATSLVEALAIEARLQLGASSHHALDAHRAWLARLAELDALTPELRRMRDAVERRAARVRT